MTTLKQLAEEWVKEAGEAERDPLATVRVMGMVLRSCAKQLLELRNEEPKNFHKLTEEFERKWYLRFHTDPGVVGYFQGGFEKGRE